MPRPLNRHQQLENAAFLKALRRTGNARAAARDLGIHRATLTKRRNAHPAFAADWDAALVIAHAALRTAARTSGKSTAHGVEPRVIRTRSGRLQLRVLSATKIDRAAEQAFLAALSATANVRLSAAAAGFSHSAFYARRRNNPGFAREMRLALEIGYERLELALMASFMPDAHADDAWRHNDPPPIPAMTADEALQLLYLHQKEVRFWDDRPDQRAKRGVSRELHSARLVAKWHEERAREVEHRLIEDAARAEPARRSAHEPAAPVLPALGQVTGWSKSQSGKARKR